MDMEPQDWFGCDLLESVPGKVSGALVFKGTRLPVENVVTSVYAYQELQG